MSIPIILRVFVLVALFSAAAIYESTHVTAIDAPELWVHVRTGTWMLENHAVPRTGLFSQYSSLPWSDSSWGFDLALGIAYRLFGLRAIPIVLMTLKAALAITIFLLVRSAGRGFWKAVVASVIAQLLIPGLQPLPYVLSILFFAVELQWLMQSRYSGSLRRLWWLPPLFVLWANLHIQFVAGLFLLTLFLISLLVECWLRALDVSWLSERVRPLPLGPVCVIALLSVSATLANPYGWRLIANAVTALYSDVAFKFFSEMSALSFRHAQEYALMLLIMANFLALGRQRSLSLFEMLILLATTVLGFRIQRDAWMAVLTAIIVLSYTIAVDRGETEPLGKLRVREWGTAVGLAFLLFMVSAARLPGRDALMASVSQNYPVKACDFILAQKLPGPLFHEYSWGSFLTWYAPQYPVVVDSRVEMYGSKLLTEYFEVVGGKERLDEHPMVANAGTLLLEKDSAMAKALLNLPGLKSQYRLVYTDDISRVFVPVRIEQ